MKRKDGLHIDDYGTQWWYLNGDLHNEVGPAVLYADGQKTWYQCGQKHRLDGPAVEWGHDNNHYYLKGIKYHYQDWLEKRKEFLIQENLKFVI